MNRQRLAVLTGANGFFKSRQAGIAVCWGPLAPFLLRKRGMAAGENMWDLAWVTDPAAWAGLGTLVLLEVVLGVDNLVFISILVNKLPQEKSVRLS